MFYVHVHVDTRQKRQYHRMSDSQIFVLQKSYAENAYPAKATLRMLGKKLGVSESKVRTWFCHQRERVNRGKHNQTLSTGKNIIVYVIVHCTYQF